MSEQEKVEENTEVVTETTIEDVGELNPVKEEEKIVIAEYGSVEWHNLVSELNTLGVLMGSTYQRPSFGPSTKKNPQGEVIRTNTLNIYSAQEIYRMKQRADQIMQKLGW